MGVQLDKCCALDKLSQSDDDGTCQYCKAYNTRYIGSNISYIVFLFIILMNVNMFIGKELIY